MNMFARKPKTVSNQAAADESNRKKLASKILDTKKEINSRLRYLRNYIESTENPLELKLFFDQNHSHIYFIFYESFVQAESNLKQKINKVHRDELELVLFIFQKILLLQPERVNQRWQSRSIGRLLQKLLHISNAKFIKITGLRLFLIWYQILNKNRTQFEELMFQKLVQGFDLFHSNAHMSSIGLDILNAEAQKVFHNQTNASAMPFSASSSNTKSTIYQFEITHLIAPSSHNDHLFHSSTQSSSSSSSQQSSQMSQQHQAQNLSSQSQANGSASISSIQSFNQSNNIYSLTAEFLKHMLSFMQNDFILVEWSSDRFKQSILGYEFLFDEFKRFYLSYMFPNAFIKHSSSGSNLATTPSASSLNVFTSLDFLSLINNDLSQQGQTGKQPHERLQDDKKQVQLNCKEEIIKWLIDVLLIDSTGVNAAPNVEMDASLYSSLQSEFKSQDEFSCDESLDSQFTSLTSIPSSSVINPTQSAFNNKHLIQRVLLSNQANINLVHEILRNVYFLNFDEGSNTVRLVLDAYKKWFLNEAKPPAFMLEPAKSEESDSMEQENQTPVFSLNNSSDRTEGENDESEPMLSHRSGSISTSIKNENRIGSVKCLQIFFYHSSNLLLNRFNLQRSDKIKNICCYALDIYKTFIKKIPMDSYTWTLLIKILLRVCNFMFTSNSDYLSLNSNSSSSNLRLNDTNTTLSSISQLVKLTTETTLMSMIKATYNFNLSNDLWDQLVTLLQTVNSNHDVVDKWMDSIDDLMRQIFKHTYNIDLNSFKSPYQNEDETEADLNARSAVSSSRSGSVSSQVDEKRKQRHKNRDKQNHQSLILNSSSSNYLLAHASQSNEKRGTKTDNNMTYSPAVLSSVGLNKPSFQNSQNNSQIPFNRQTSAKHSLQNTFRDDTYLHTIVNSMVGGNEIEQSKSPSLTDENFLNLTEPKTADQFSEDLRADTDLSMVTSEPLLSRHDDEDDEEMEIDEDSYDYNQYFSNNSRRRNDQDSYNGEDEEADCTSSINETDSNDSALYDKSATLKATNQIDQLTSYNTNTIKSNTLTNFNRFSPGEKSIYYSSELLVDKPNTSGSSSITSATSPTLQVRVDQADETSTNPDEETSSFEEQETSKSSQNSASNNSFNSNSNNTPNTQTTNLSCSSSSSPNPNTQTSPSLNQNLKQLSPRVASQSPNQSSSNVPPPLPPLPASLPPKFYLLSKSNQLDIGEKSRKSVETDIQTDSSPSSVQASPLGKLTISMGQMSIPVDLSPKNKADVSKQEAKSMDRSDERSASFIMDTPRLKVEPIKSNQSLLTISSTKANRQSLSIVASSSDTEIDENKKFKATSLMLLKRLFGCMGNVNLIKDPLIHKKIFEFILIKWSKLCKIKDEIISMANTSSDMCEIIMPHSYFAAWLFESIHKYLLELSCSIPPSLCVNYQSATLIAYKILANIVIKSACSSDDQFYSISSNFLDLFYITLHYGLISNDKSVLNCIIQSCSTKFWHLMLESSSLLIKDFMIACLQIDTQGPKFEAISTLGSFICLPEYFGESITFLSPAAKSTASPSLSPSDSLNTVVFSRDEFKNLLVNSLSDFELSLGPDLDNASSMHAFNSSKSVLLCALTCLIYDEIVGRHFWNSTRMTEACKKIFKDLEYRDQYSPVLIKMSCDSLRFLSCLANFIFNKEIQFAINIINELNQCLVKLINNKPVGAVINENYEKAIIANMFALLEWCVNMPLEKLKDQDRATLLKNNFKLIIHISNTFKPAESAESEHIHLSAKFIISHLLNHLNHYPYGTYGPTKICSSCNEISDLVLMQSSDCKQSDSNNNSNVPNDELSILLFEQPNVQFFSVNNQYLISLVEHPIKSSSNDLFLSDSWQEQLKICSTACRVIVRDFSGKYCWDCCLLNSLDHLAPKAKTLEIPVHPEPDSSSTQSAPHPNTESFDFQQLTSLENEQIPKDIDLLKNVIDYMNYSSPECRLDTLISTQSPSVGHYSPNLQFKDQFVFNSLDEIKEKLMSCETSIDFGEKAATSSPDKKSDPEPQPPANNDFQSHHYFNLCKSFVHQLGFLSREKRQTFNLLHKSAQLLRELKSLDDQTCRETHKIALIYIAKGQQDKQSILSNEKGSKDYNDFLSALAWPVHLETHEGFMGGLQHVSSQLKSAPYYSNSLCEVLFHVSTQMNNANDQNKISKWRHLGNDSVQIIWSEHTKDYDRSILATEFADVIICVYPLSNGLYRVQIIKKASVGFFGPLFDGAILHKNIMAHLVRATAINASRVLLSSTKGYQDFYVHRAHAISNIVNKLTEKQTFEQFVSDVYSPNLEFLARTKCAESNANANVSSPVMNSSSIAALSATHFDSEKQLVF